jgi:hypothetical protein
MYVWERGHLLQQSWQTACIADADDYACKASSCMLFRNMAPQHGATTSVEWTSSLWHTCYDHTLFVF